MASENKRSNSKSAARKHQIATYYGIQPEPALNDPNDIDWMGWIDHLHDLDWEKVPVDWKPGDPRDPEAEAREQSRIERRKSVAAWMAEVRAGVANVRARKQAEAHRALKSQVGIYHGIGPEPARDSGKWEDWIETLYMFCDWEKVPEDWQPGDPTAADIKREREADYALARLVESSRGGRST